MKGDAWMEVVHRRAARVRHRAGEGRGEIRFFKVAFSIEKTIVISRLSPPSSLDERAPA